MKITEKFFFQHLRHSSPSVSNVMCIFKHHELLAESHVIEVRKYNILLRWKNLYFFLEFECLYKKFDVVLTIDVVIQRSIRAESSVN